MHFVILFVQNYETASQTNIVDTNQSDVWMYADDFPPSRTQTNRNSLAMTTTSLPIQYRSRDEFDTSIKEFSRLWPSRTERLQPMQPQPQQQQQHSSNRFDDSRYCTVASNDLKNDGPTSNYMKRNGALISGGVPLAPLTLDTDPNAWDLPSASIENQNRKFLFQFKITKGECSACSYVCMDFLKRKQVFPVHTPMT